MKSLERRLPAADARARTDCGVERSGSQSLRHLDASTVTRARTGCAIPKNASTHERSDPDRVRFIASTSVCSCLGRPYSDAAIAVNQLNLVSRGLRPGSSVRASAISANSRTWFKLRTRFGPLFRADAERTRICPRADRSSRCTSPASGGPSTSSRTSLRRWSTCSRRGR